MRELDTNNHSVFAMYYHLVLVIKYRRKVINEDVSVRLQEIFEDEATHSRDFSHELVN